MRKTKTDSGTKATNRRLAIWMSFSLVLASALGFWWWWSQADAGPYAYKWTPGKTYVYRLNHTESSAMELGGGPLGDVGAFSGSANVKGELWVRCYSQDESKAVLGLSVRADQAEIVAMGTPAIGDENATSTALRDAEVFVEVSPNGTVRGVRTSAETNSVAASYLKGLWAVLLAVTQPERSYEVEERSVIGLSKVRYTWRKNARSSRELLKLRESWTNVAAVSGPLSDKDVEKRGGALAVLSSKGHLESMQAEDTLRVAEKSGDVAYELSRKVEVKLERIEGFSQSQELLARLIALRSTKLEEVEVSDQAEQKALLQRTMGMDVARVVTDLLRYGDGGQMPDHARWVWRATGALKLDPKGCTELAKVAVDTNRSSDGRRFITELLVSVGSDEAQAALRELLSADTTKSDPKYYDILQRLSLLEHPQPETAQFAQSLLKDGSFEVRMGSAFTVGALSRALSANGDETLGAQLNTELRGLMESAKDSDEQAGYLAALGNAGREDNVPYIAKAAQSPSSDVRRTTADALRHTQTKEAESTILDLASDRDDSVQRAALETLEGWKLEPRHIEALEKKLEEGRITPQAKTNLTRLLAQELRSGDPDKSAVSRRMLEQMVNGSLPTSLRYQIGGLLKNGSVGSEQFKDE
jgi:hypothetical protein